MNIDTVLERLGAFSEFSDFGWRELLIALIALLVLYVVVSLLRLRRAQNRLGPRARAAVAAYVTEQEPAEQKPEFPPTSETISPTEPALIWNEPSAQLPGQQRIEALEHAFAQLHNEVMALRGELQTQRTLAETRAKPNIPPLYSDAMQMAMQGHDAATIAAHWGIARAEAELIVALVRNRDTAA